MKRNSYKKIREYLGLTQQELSAILGMSQPHLAAVEKGITGMNDDIKTILHYKYGISYKFMIEGIGAMVDKSFQSSRNIIIEINGKKTKIKESEFKSINVWVEKEGS